MIRHHHRITLACLVLFGAAAASLPARATEPGASGDDTVISARAAEPQAPPRPAANCRTRGSVEAGVAVGGGGSARHLGARLDYGEDVPAPAGAPLLPCEQTGIAASLQVGQTSGDLGRSPPGDRIAPPARPHR